MAVGCPYPDPPSGTVVRNSFYCAYCPGDPACMLSPGPYSPPPVTTGGVGSAPAPTVVPGGPISPSCGSCRKSQAPAGGPPPNTTSTGPAVGSTPSVKRTDYPWWVLVLAVMALAQIIGGGNHAA